MKTIIVEDVERGTPYTTKHGSELVPYQIRFGGNDARGVGELSQKPETPAPQVGDTLTVEIIPGRLKDPDDPDGPRFPSRLKKVQAGAPSSSPSNGFRGKSPEEGNRIARMNSQARALEYLKLKADLNNPQPVESWEQFTRIIDLFYDDCKAAS